MRDGEDGSCSPPALRPVRTPLDFSVFFFFPYFVWGKRMGFWFLKQVVGAAGMEQELMVGMEQGLTAGLEQGCGDRPMAGLRGQAGCSGLELSGKDS